MPLIDEFVGSGILIRISPPLHTAKMLGNQSYHHHNAVKHD